MLFMISNP
jgi:ubiquitin fusion degradation protein 1